jgi:hypothetical protein
LHKNPVPEDWPILYVHRKRPVLNAFCKGYRASMACIERTNNIKIKRYLDNLRKSCYTSRYLVKLKGVLYELSQKSDMEAAGTVLGGKYGWKAGT